MFGSPVLPLLRLLALAWLLSSCQDDESIFNGSGTRRSRAQQGSSLDAEAGKVYDLVKAAYTVEVSGLLGSFCKGAGKIKFDSTFNLDVLEPTVTCLGFTFDLSQLINPKILNPALQASVGSTDKLKESFAHDGMMLLMKKGQNTAFEPARPLLVGPVVVSPDKYANFSRSSNVTYTRTDPSTGQATSRSGTFNTRVIDALTSYQNGNVNLPRVIHWEMTATGFEEIPAIYGLTFSRIEWWWSTRPLMIPKIAVDLTVSDLALISAGPIDSAISSFLGKLTVTISADSMETLQ